ncbi:MAG: PEP-CTERM sorting domain-containing protein [Crocosphaera sp.]|nr:PEP-CTERM sorting domain-containing protein [Crocosphaera sp.]
MKKFIQSLSIGTTGLTIAIVLGGKPVNALTFEFSQSGWQPGGGEVIGTFSGEDKDGDNMIIFDPDPAFNEVSAYEMNFSGNSTFMDFTHTLDNIDLSLFFLEYALADSSIFISSIGDGGGPFPEDPPNIANGRISNYDTDSLDNTSIITQDGQPNPLETIETVTTNPKEVSEPTSLIGLILLGLSGYFKRKRFF